MNVRSEHAGVLNIRHTGAMDVCRGRLTAAWRRVVGGVTRRLTSCASARVASSGPWPAGRVAVGLSLMLLLLLPSAARGQDVEFRGRVVDAESGVPIPARVYLRSESGDWLFVESATDHGSALPYAEEWVPMPQSVERHTTISADPFRIALPPGRYVLEVERGKEYLPHRETIVVDEAPVETTVRLRRWIDAAARGWYSGETHVHRRIHELPNVMRAEDLNVAFPVTFWTVASDAVPDRQPSTLRRQGPSPFGPREDRGVEPIVVDPTRVIFPRNTEYEIFSVDGRRHVLGAMFILNHRTIFDRTAPPVMPIAEQAHAEGALLDLDKHSWPWSLMLVPVAEIDLFELSNNSVWRTEFGFSAAPADPPPWATLEHSAPGQLTEWGWLNWGFEVYYALLNCGFRLTPTAGTASGVHPVPLGHSRVYVHTGDQFRADDWLAGLRAGRSFVTTGPMLFARVNDRLPGAEFLYSGSQPRDVLVEVDSWSARPPERIEILVNGQVVATHTGPAEQADAGGWNLRFQDRVAVNDTSWIAVRGTVRQPDGRRRFAHTAPWHVVIDDRPMRPPAVQARYFVEMLEAEVSRNAGVLDQAAMAEFERALSVYRSRLDRAR